LVQENIVIDLNHRHHKKKAAHIVLMCETEFKI